MAPERRVVEINPRGFGRFFARLRGSLVAAIDYVASTSCLPRSHKVWRSW